MGGDLHCVQRILGVCSPNALNYYQHQLAENAQYMWYVLYDAVTTFCAFSLTLKMPFDCSSRNVREYAEVRLMLLV